MYVPSISAVMQKEKSRYLDRAEGRVDIIRRALDAHALRAVSLRGARVSDRAR
jgi:hypothetical protein